MQSSVTENVKCHISRFFSTASSCWLPLDLPGQFSPKSQLSEPLQNCSQSLVSSSSTWSSPSCPSAARWGRRRRRGTCPCMSRGWRGTYKMVKQIRPHLTKVASHPCSRLLLESSGLNPMPVLKLSDFHFQDPRLKPALPGGLVWLCSNPCHRPHSCTLHVLLRPCVEVVESDALFNTIPVDVFANFLLQTYVYLLISCYRPNTRLWPLAVIGGALWVPGSRHSKDEKSETQLFCCLKSCFSPE